MPEYGYSIFLLLYSKIIFIRISDTIVNGFIVYSDSRITDNHRAVATLSYIGPSSLLSVVLTTQTQKGSMNIYIRNFDNSISEDGTNVQIDVLLYSRFGTRFPSINEVRTSAELPNVTMIYYNNQGQHEGHFRMNLTYNTFIDITVTENELWFGRTVNGVFMDTKVVASFDNKI